MRAVAIAPDRSLQVVDLPRPEPGPGEVRVAVSYCGICGSDLHLRPTDTLPIGAVMGHEIAGRVEAVGPDVRGWVKGDRVAVFPYEPCGTCPSCRAGSENVCINASSTGLGLGPRQGAYAEAVVVSASMLHRLPKEVSDDYGALAEPLAVALHGIAVADVPRGAPVCIIGAGPIGLMTAYALRARGHSAIAVVERNPKRREHVASLGFAAVAPEDVHMGVLGALGHRLPAAVFECAGSPEAPALAVELIAHNGRVVLLGVLAEPVFFSQLLLLIKEAELRASFAYRAEEFTQAIDMLRARVVPARELVTRTVDLSQAQAMFEELARPDTPHVKVLLHP